MTLTPVKRAYSFQDYIGTGAMEWLGEHNYEVILSINFDAPTLAATMTRLDELEDARVPAWLSIEAPINAATINGVAIADAVESDYETAYGAAIDTLETASSNLLGFAYEHGWCPGVNWLRERTARNILYFWAPTAHYNWIGQLGGTWYATYGKGAFVDGWVGYGARYGQGQTINYRMERVDEIVFEFYAMDEIENAWRILNYARTNYPEKRIGLICLQGTCGRGSGPNTPEYTSVNWMMDNLYAGFPDGGPPVQSWLTEEQITTRVRWGAQQIKEQLGYLDTFVVDWMAVDCPPAGSGAQLPEVPIWIARSEYWESLNLFTPGTKQIHDMSQIGVSPCYAGASPYCYHDPLPDTFANTGNEIILLKDVGTTSSHDITVTSTDTFTHEDYTLALSPDRGTIIGPYPLDYYGALPTITYDTTNLYVSILKVEPTA